MVFLSKKVVCVLAFAAISVLVFSAYTAILASSAAVNGFSLPCTINTPGAAWNGIIAFDLSGNGADAFVVMDTNGMVLSVRQTNNSTYGAAYNIADNTVLFQGEPQVDGANSAPTYATHIWDLATNTTEDYPNVIGEHDIQYDPVNNTFLTLQQYVQPVGNNLYLIDKIVELNANGTVLWSWNPYNYIPLSEASPFNETSTLNGQTLIDFTHANSLDWDYQDNIIYLNLRNINTFYKINQTNGDIIWAYGEYGNFTLLGANGQPLTSSNGLPPSLWYHCHDVKEVAPDVFTMFNNDYYNNTNPNDSRSSLMEVTLNETSMTASVTWNWEAPVAYWNEYGGANVPLPNGDYLGCFGDPTHQDTQNEQPNGTWNFTNSGAVFVEVTPEGQVVRTWTFPVGYYAYRVEALTNMTAFGSPPPTPTTSASPSPYASPPAKSIVASLILPIVIGAVIVVAVVVAVVIALRRTRANKRV